MCPFYLAAEEEMVPTAAACETLVAQIWHEGIGNLALGQFRCCMFRRMLLFYLEDATHFYVIETDSVPFHGASFYTGERAALIELSAIHRSSVANTHRSISTTVNVKQRWVTVSS